MRTIPAAMTWELMSRGRWSLSALALVMLAFPMLIIWSIGSISLLNPEDRSTHLLNFLFMQANLTTGVGALLVLNMQQARRLYPYPATAATLANGQMLPAAMVLTVGLTIWTFTLNGLFGLDWPLWEPALFGVAALVAAYAAMWLGMGSLWMIPFLAVVCALFGIWMKWHYGPMFGDPEHGWSSITPLEAFALAALTVVSHRGAVLGLARARRGEPPISVGVVAWIESLAERTPAANARFSSPAAAQTWYFQQRGWVAPFTVLIVSTLALIIWSFVSRDVVELVVALAHGSWFLAIAALLGGISLGALGSRDEVVIGQFLATRPMTTVDLSRRLLVVAAKNLGLAWFAWVSIFLLIMLALLIAGHAPWDYLPPEFRWLSLAGAMLLSWIAMSSVLAVALIGRSQLIVRTVVGLSFGYVALMLFGKFALTPQAFDALMHGLVTLIGVGCTLGTIAAMVVALRRGLIEAPVAGAAVAVWITLIAACILAWPAGLEITRSGEFLLYGALALVVAPIAAAPLALAWNRIR